MLSKSRPRLGSIWFAAALSAVGLALGGCLSASQGHAVRVEAAAPPQTAAAVSRDIARKARATGAQKFLAAREAFWSYDTDKAVQLLRELHREGALEPEPFHWLVLQCYEQSERWSESLPLFAEFGLADEYPDWLTFSKFRAGLPRRQITFAAAPTMVPMAMKHDDLIIVEAQINGVTGRLLVDTGAAISWLTESFAHAAQTDALPQTVALGDANDRWRDTPFGLIHELRIGEVAVRDTPALIGRSALLQLSTPVDGILGWDILQHIDVTFDFPARQMTLAEPGGPVCAAANLSGRTGPILKLVSATGRPLHVFFDTGAHSGRACIDLFEGDGGVAPAGLGEFRRAWRPTISLGMNSVSWAWPQFAEPFAFWLAGHRFEVPTAALYRRVQQQERLIHLDGMVGNAPFLSGRLRLCGVKRLVEFELANSEVSRGVMARAKE